MKAFIEKQMRINDEATSIQIQKQLAKRGRYELLHCAKIASQTGMDAVAHSLLSTDKSS